MPTLAEHKTALQAQVDISAECAGGDPAGWWVYMLQCNDQSYYTGITTNLARRLHEHNCDTKRGARYTRTRTPVQLVYQEHAINRSEASKREAHIRKLTRAAKRRLINGVGADPAGGG